MTSNPNGVVPPPSFMPAPARVASSGVKVGAA